LVRAQGHLEVDDFVQPRRTAPYFDLITNADVVDCQRVLVEQRERIAGPECHQEVEMWRRFGRLVEQREEAASPPMEGRAFWRDVALTTQAVMDACMASAFEHGGCPVPVVLPRLV
jgi:hypothetical protein